MKKVLFVCLGNICRSPTAEGVFKKIVLEAQLEGQIKVDSAGTLSHHQGESPDPRMIHHAKQRGYQLTSRARGLKASDLDRFDYILTMDDSNFSNVQTLSTPDNQHKIQKMTDYCVTHSQSEVPDPYYGGPDGFELVIDLLEDACQELLKKIKTELELSNQTEPCAHKH